MKATMIAGLALLGVVLVSGGGAQAAVVDGTLSLDSSAALSANGRAIVVGGELQCDAGQRVTVTVNPASGTPNALGKTAFACTGEPQRFELTVRMRGNGVKFEDIGSTVLFARADTGDDVDSWSGVVSW
jgi:hypothetical protein